MEVARVDAFVAALHKAAVASTAKPLVRATLYTLAPTASDPHTHTLLSWKAQEYAYRQWSLDRDQLPTLARGLFTEEVRQGEHTHQRIAVRGYDKFFNLSELAWTQPTAIATYSQGPYVVSYKENGCIIFVAALSPTRLVVTSKHAIGGRAEDEHASHSEMGHTWLLRHLAKAKQTELTMAADLWERNATAVMELCDDAFEEHVLAYPEQRSGLHVHGLNTNAVDFATAPMEEVTRFAETYGLFPVRFRTFDTLAEVNAFADEVGKTGTLNNEPMEGFVVRTRMASHGAASDSKRPPYTPGQTWFYKIKFDEPYLMYRDWRELTRTMLREHKAWEERQPTLVEAVEDVSVEDAAPNERLVHAQKEFEEGTISKKELKRIQKSVDRSTQRRSATAAKERQAAGLAPPTPPTPRSLRKETWLYVQWCWDLLYGNPAKGVAPEPALFAAFHKGHGIIALRERFLAYLQTPEGQEQLARVGKKGTSAARDLRLDTRPFEKTLLVPIAVPGSGKTALGVALAHLFPWAHIQSDDVQNKRTGPTFLRNVSEGLKTHDVVFADRNNHLLQHREELVELVRKASAPPAKAGDVQGGRIRLVALAWRMDGIAHAAIQHLCTKRIIGRGERHQCLRVSDKEKPFAYDMILARFLKDMQPFQAGTGGEGSVGAADDQFTDVIWMEWDEPLEAALERVLDTVCPMLSLPRPSKSAVDAALEAGRTYVPSVRKALPTIVAREDPLAVLPTSYIGVFPLADIAALAEQRLTLLPDEQRASAQALLETIRANDRAVRRPHITLVHHGDQDAEAQQLWSTLYPIATRSETERPTYELRVCALVWDDRVMALEVASMRSPTLAVSEELLHRAGRTPHVTIGTRDATVQAYEANALFAPGSQAHRVEFAVELPAVLGFHSNPKPKES